jgi:hypothetical protein
MKPKNHARAACGYRSPRSIPIPELRPHAGLLIRARYLPEPGKALDFQCLQSKPDTALRSAKGVGNSFQTLTNWVPRCQRGNPLEVVTKAG